MLKNREVTLKGLANLLGMKYLTYPDGYATITYDQFATPSSSRVASECRGVIFDRDYNIVCRPFDRFFNYNERECTIDGINFAKAKVMDKLDGSLIKIWFDVIKLQWRVATSGRIYGETQVADHGFTFKELVYKAIGVENDEQFNDRCETFDINTTYIYEVTSRETRIVTRYEEPELWYLAARKNSCGTYIDFDGTVIGAKLPKQYDLNSIEKCYKAAEAMSNHEEGFVVYIDNVPVAKIKSPKYVAAHLIKGEGLSIGRICNLITNNEIDEYLTYFPEDTDRIMPYFKGMQKFYDNLELEYKKFSHIDNRIEFSAATNGNKLKDLMFTMFNHKVDAKTSFSKLLNTSKKKIIIANKVEV